MVLLAILVLMVMLVILEMMDHGDPRAQLYVIMSLNLPFHVYLLAAQELCI